MKEEIIKKTGKPSLDKPWLKYYPKEVIDLELPKQTIYEYIYTPNQGNLNRTALNYFDKKITYRELFKKIDEIALALKAYGVKEGDIVSVAMPTTPESVYLFYAISKIGAISNMIDPRTSTDGIIDYINEVDSKLFFGVDKIFPKINGIKEKTNLDKIVLISPTDSLPVGMQLGSDAIDFFNAVKEVSNPKLIQKAKVKKECTSWNEFYDYHKTLDEKSIVIPSYQENKPAVIVHTGGTTGTPKGVMLTHDNLNCAAFQCAIAGYDFKKYHSWLDVMPLFIAYGVGNGLHLPLSLGMELILIPEFKPEKFDKLLNKYRPNHMTGVPTHYDYLLNSKLLKDADLSYMLSPTVGGDAMEVSLEENTNEWLRQRGCEYRVSKGYGMTEVNAAVCACISDDTNKVGSVGVPFSHTVISIFDSKTKKELGYNEWGEICITGPNTMLGYFNNQKETEHVLKKHDDGIIWVHSGDIGYMDEEGNLFVRDRTKRMIIRHDGFNNYPSKIENVIVKDSRVKACQVVGKPDEKHSQGKLPVAYIILNDENISSKEVSAITKDLKKACEKELPEYEQPSAFWYVDFFPQTSIGKIDYRALEAGNREDFINEKEQGKRLLKNKLLNKWLKRRS